MIFLSNFLQEFRKTLGVFSLKYICILIFGDFNTETYECDLKNFCELHDLRSNLLFSKIQRTPFAQIYFLLANRTVFVTSVSNLNNCNNNYKSFKNVVKEVIKQYVPQKIRYIPGNQAPFMNSILKNIITKRSRLRNKLLKTRSSGSQKAYNKQRNFYLILIKKVKREYYCKLVRIPLLSHKKCD